MKFWEKWWNRNRSASKQDKVGIYWSQSGVTLAHISGTARVPMLRQLVQWDQTQSESGQITLSKQVADLNLQGSLANVLISPSDCQIFLIDQPQVPENEKKEAVHWQIAGMIDFPIEDATVDYIELPYK